MRAQECNAKRSKLVEPPSIWGDGFADDGFEALLAVRDFETVAADEYVRLFPRLMHNEAFQALLLAGLRTRARWLLADARSSSSRHFARASRAASATFSVPHSELRLTQSSMRARALLRMFVAAFETGSSPSFDYEQAEAVAFHASIHPAYFWAEAFASHSFFSALGWLGIVMSGRPAFLPIDIAESLLEMLGPVGRREEASDCGLARFVGDDRLIRGLLQQAEERALGRAVIVDLARLGRSAASERFWAVRRVAV